MSSPAAPFTRRTLPCACWARGILTEYLTRLYFADEPDNARDVVLQSVPAARRATLVAVPGAAAEYHLDIVVQGEGETVFFDV